MMKVNLKTLKVEEESIPCFLKGLKKSSIADLGWTDKSLGLNGYGWWPVVDRSTTLDRYERYSETEKTLEANAESRVVFVTKKIEKWTQEEIEADLARAKTEKLSELLATCDEDLKQLAKGYPERETQTWVVQLEEAKAYLADNTSPTPFISAALKDGETVEQYANLIVANNTAWSDYAGKVVLKRRTFETAIKAATTIDEVRNISWRL